MSRRAATRQCGAVALQHPQAISDRLEAPLTVKAKRRRVVHVGVHVHSPCTKAPCPRQRVMNQGPGRTPAPRRWQYRKALEIRGILAHPGEAVTNGRREGKCTASSGTSRAEPKCGPTRIVKGTFVECPLVTEGGHVDAHRFGPTHRADAPTAGCGDVVRCVELTNEKVKLLAHGEPPGKERIGHRGPNGTGAHALKRTRTRRVGPFIDQ